MPTFIDVHEGFLGVTEEQFTAAHQADLDIEAEEGVHFERAWLDPPREESHGGFALGTLTSRTPRTRRE